MNNKSVFPLKAVRWITYKLFVLIISVTRLPEIFSIFDKLQQCIYQTGIFAKVISKLSEILKRP